jgi:Domain of unknown function (DUF4389)
MEGTEPGSGPDVGAQPPPSAPPPTGTQPPAASAPPPTGAQPPATSARPSSAFPIRLEFEYPTQPSKLTFVKWILAIPQVIVLGLVGMVAYFMLIYAWFSVLITERYPRNAYDFMVGVGRWATRVNAYIFFMAEEYPPFSMDEIPSYPAHFEPPPFPGEQMPRATALQPILAIPAFIFSAILVYVAELVALVAGIMIIANDEYPRGMYDFVVGALRAQARTFAYATMMTTQYPPFELE